MSPIESRTISRLRAAVLSDLRGCVRVYIRALHLDRTAADSENMPAPLGTSVANRTSGGIPLPERRAELPGNSPGAARTDQAASLAEFFRASASEDRDLEPVIRP